MELFTPEINWHNRDPIYSIDICSVYGKYERVVSSGTDTSIRVWSLNVRKSSEIKLQFRSRLERHSMSVNVVRFSPDASLLSSCGDGTFEFIILDGLVILWNLIIDSICESTEYNSELFNDLETWNSLKTINAHSDGIFDISWSPDSNFLLTACVDNTASLIDVKKGFCLFIFRDARHYIQGVCWDPLNEFLVTTSSDATCHIYDLSSKKLFYSLRKCDVLIENNIETKKLFRDESLSSFFRRCAFSPDGQILVVPSGISIFNENESTTFLFQRSRMHRPYLELPTNGKDSVVVRFFPHILTPTLTNSPKMIEMIFAVGTLDSVIIYDTFNLDPVSYISSIHYAAITDLSWSTDSKYLLISSVDGFCSIVSFIESQNYSPCIIPRALPLNFSVPISETQIKPSKRRAKIIPAHDDPHLSQSSLSKDGDIQNDSTCTKKVRRVNFTTLEI